MKPPFKDKVKRVLDENLDGLTPYDREQVLNRVIMKYFMDLIRENPTWYEDHPELAQSLSGWMQRLRDNADEEE